MKKKKTCGSLGLSPDVSAHPPPHCDPLLCCVCVCVRARIQADDDVARRNAAAVEAQTRGCWKRRHRMERHLRQYLY